MLLAMVVHDAVVQLSGAIAGTFALLLCGRQQRALMQAAIDAAR
jgi:hypothetical protein